MNATLLMELNQELTTCVRNEEKNSAFGSFQNIRILQGLLPQRGQNWKATYVAAKTFRIQNAKLIPVSTWMSLCV